MEKLITALYMHMPDDILGFARKFLEDYVPEHNPKEMGVEEYRIREGHDMFWCGAFDPGACHPPHPGTHPQDTGGC